MAFPSSNINWSKVGYEDMIRRFDGLADRAPHVQRLVLRDILERNKDTEYLQRMAEPALKKLAEAASSGGEVALRRLEERFRSTVPLSTYADVEPFIDRIVRGDHSNVLCADRILHLNMSSGTSSGKPKLFPGTSRTSQYPIETMWLSSAFRERCYPMSEHGKALAFVHAAKRYETPGGILAGAMTANYFWSEAFKDRPLRERPPIARFASPDDVLFEADAQQSMYAHLLAALLRRPELESCSSLFPFTLIEGFKLLEQLWPELCHDIENGTLSPLRISSPSLRSSLEQHNPPKPHLAHSIRNECEKASWDGILQRLWPNLKYVQCVITGPMASYVPALRYYCGSLPLVSGEYGCSECAWLGINLNPKASQDNVSFTLVPHLAYVEFMPIHASSGSCTVGIDEVEVGHEYELVLTTYAGLYRHRLGDVVQITGFYKGTPQFSYVMRRNGLLTLCDDKTDEKELQYVMEKAVLRLEEAGLELIEYTCHVSKGSNAITSRSIKAPCKSPHPTSASDPLGHYDIFWEVKGHVEGDVAQQTLQHCCEILDRSLGYYYIKGRCAPNPSIGPLQLWIVREGTFTSLAEQAISLGTHLMQYKTPRIINSSSQLKTLHGNALKCFFSPPMPSHLLTPLRVPLS